MDHAINFGTVVILLDGSPYEITHFRDEGNYDGRRPKVVRFQPSLVEDARRRDFTINSIYYGLREGFIDPNGGLGDATNNKLRFVGHYKDRLNEDKLRVMRYVRFKIMCGIGRNWSWFLRHIWRYFTLNGLSKERLHQE